MFTASDVRSSAEIWRGFVHHSRTFSLAARLLPAPVRMPVATLYIFCRTVDNIADERVLEIGPQKALTELNQLEQTLDRTLSGNPPELFFWKEFADVHRQWPLNRVALYELIRGAEWDLKGSTVENPDDLLHYAGLVGGSVGAMMLPFLVDQDQYGAELDDAARSLGNAMQITNIVRDVGQDHRELDRCYLPSNWMDELGIARKDIEAGVVNDRYIELLERLMNLADPLYTEGFDGIRALPGKARTGIMAAARMYREIMNEVRANGYNNLDRRAYVSNMRKLKLLLLDGYQRRKSHLSRRSPDIQSIDSPPDSLKS